MAICRCTSFALSGATLMMFLASTPAQAHAFGARYDLPLPLDLYLAGAGVAVALSFLIMALVFRTGTGSIGGPRIDLLRFRPMRALIHPVVVGILQVISVGLFFVVLAAGFFGTQDPATNFGPTFIWIIWWVGLAYVAAMAGNLWPAINPWSAVFAWVEGLVRRFGGQNGLAKGLAYPSWLGVWPAVALFGFFAWFELISEMAKVPATLATFILIYSVLTWLGMFAFGRGVWLANGEAFSLAFGVFGRFAPIAPPGRDRPDGQPVNWYLRPYAGGLVVEKPCDLSMTVFVLLMLATVTFDGFKETPLWAGLLEGIASEPLFHPLLRGLHDLGFDFPVVLETVMLVFFPIMFFLVYLAFCWLAKEVSDSERPVMEIAGLFVFSLVPIAIAYHLAHYLSYLLIGGQLIIPLASDPFGYGWNLFNTSDYGVDIGVIGTKVVWYTAVAAIVIGHVFGVGVAHFVALNSFESARVALKSQYPIVVLMVGYTMVSLWILAQPIIAIPNMGILRAPSGTLSLAPFEFRELCYELASRDEIQYDFQSDRPVEFDIHYHDGLRIRYPVHMSGITVGADRFSAELDQFYCLMWTNQSLMTTSLTYKVVGP